MKKIVTIIRKEWAEVFKNKMVFSTVIFMPLLFTALPLIMLYVTGQTAGSEDLVGEMPPQFTRVCGEGVSPGDCMRIFLINQFMLLFMLTPLIIPVNIAAYSIVGEKTTRSLEPLLATPITTSELLTGKNLAAAIPAVGATWISFLLYIVGAWVVVENPGVVRALLDPMWWIAIFLVGPLLAVLSVNFSIMVSSRVNDPRVAEQLSAVVIVPILALFFGQISGVLFINRALVLLLALALVFIDGIMVAFAVRLFQRETILTRWK
jgi:ABC-2 type transport system permease protein